MNKQQLIRLVGVFGAALLLWAVLAIVRRPPSDRPERLALPKVDTSSVDTVALGATILARSGKLWRVNGYPTDSDAIAGMLTALADTSATPELVAESKTSRAGLAIIDPAPGTPVHVVSHGKPVLDLIVYDGRYVRRPNEEALYVMRGGIASTADKTMDYWRDKRIVSVVPESIAMGTLQRGAHTITIRDTTRLNALRVSYRALRATGFADSMAAHPTIRARLMSKSGAILANLLFDSSASGVRVRADSGGTVYRLDSSMLTQLVPAK